MMLRRLQDISQFSEQDREHIFYTLDASHEMPKLAKFMLLERELLVF